MAAKKRFVEDWAGPAPTEVGDTFYGLDLDDEQRVFANAILNPDKLVVIADAKAGTGKTTVSVGAANMLCKHGVYEGIDIIAVSNWLYGHKDYRWLEICQPDMENIRYRCIVTELKQIEVAGYQVAFEATAQCDGPYAYISPHELIIQNTSTGKYRIYNPSNVHDLYYPHMAIHCPSGTSSISIYNEHEPERVFSINIPSGTAPVDIDIDGENQLVTPPAFCEHMNANFVRLLDGDNCLVVSGTCNIVMTISPPVSVGC